jgi:hypothetical protein
MSPDNFVTYLPGWSRHTTDLGNAFPSALGAARQPPAGRWSSGEIEAGLASDNDLPPDDLGCGPSTPLSLVSPAAPVPARQWSLPDRVQLPSYYLGCGPDRRRLGAAAGRGIAGQPPCARSRRAPRVQAACPRRVASTARRWNGYNRSYVDVCFGSHVSDPTCTPLNVKRRLLLNSASALLETQCRSATP